MTALPLDWSLIQLLLTLAESGSLSRAASRLGLSQPTLSRQLVLLEEQVGQTLFERHPRGLSLTAGGKALMPAAQRMRDAARELDLVLASSDRQLAGTVRLTASEVVATFVLPAVLRPLREQHPEIQLELVASNEIEDLVARHADIALRMLRPTEHSLVARKLVDLPLGVYAHRSYLARAGVPTPATLRQHQWLGFDQADQLIRGFAQAGFEVEREFFGWRCDDMTVNWEAMRAGLGLNVGLCGLAERDPELVRVLHELEIPPLPLWITAHRELRDTPRLRLVFDHLAEHLPGALAAPTIAR
ncbi:LysR family transcriptional regulator [Pelomonas sp. SE-A7]|uniref:LysR family transcriptional regulator n=1 Tax=Pelomonas sp. SE-A7 TaxID=3054953 RepID=UPI00259D1936|nr:LysR family transcriptional regulator [Pelomonas sp. SE-A7]MDM4766450.1 LysR family transcriptional regulator [Pelomonas sp. SE-A7]